MNLRERYNKEIVPALQKELGATNVHSVPKVLKVTVSVGIPAAQKDSKFIETVEHVLSRVTGQKPVDAKAKKSISGFKIRDGMVVGKYVTLRGEKMWSFLEKLVNVTFPRVTDFRGISTKVIDKTGNLSVGFREYLPFPEISPDEVERVCGIQVTITTDAGDYEKGLALFKQLGFPFQK
ncbi:50S ribosomal protein L5 [Candidatus Uhrbacteria bacterium]|nr:50S ribosomal protein L5 [Candidatus Uhrbacteria bacterium]